MEAADAYGPWEIAGYRVRIEPTPRPRLIAARGDVDLRSLPEAVRRSDDMAWVRLLLDGALERRRQLRDLLERAMVTGATLSRADLGLLREDPIGRGILEGLVVRCCGTLGVPWLSEGLVESIGGSFDTLDAPLWIPHPISLEHEGVLGQWQNWMDKRFLTQPFKQLRRERYYVGEPDGPDPAASSRFVGTAVRWDQSRAILTHRGWNRVTKSTAERYLSAQDVTLVVFFGGGGRRGLPDGAVTLGVVRACSGKTPNRDQAKAGSQWSRLTEIVRSECLRDLSLVASACSAQSESNGLDGAA